MAKCTGDTSSATISVAVSQFDKFPASALVSLSTGGTLLDRSRASLYRDIKAGRLTLVKVGCSSRIKVGELRNLMSGEAA